MSSTWLSWPCSQTTRAFSQLACLVLPCLIFTLWGLSRVYLSVYFSRASQLLPSLKLADVRLLAARTSQSQFPSLSGQKVRARGSEAGSSFTFIHSMSVFVLP